MNQELLSKAEKAKEASRSLAYTSTGVKNKALMKCQRPGVCNATGVAVDLQECRQIGCGKL